MMTQASANPWCQPLSALLAGVINHDVPECDIEFITMDSRQVRPGTLFLAVAGLKRHGLEFIEHAWSAGAVAVVYEPAKGVEAPPIPAGKVCLPVSNLSMHLGVIAARFFDHPSRAIKVCGITGTNGKTTITHLISKAMRFLGQRCGHMGTLGFGLNEPFTPSDLTTPDAVTVHQRLAWMHEQRADFVAMEVSSHALDQHRVGAVEFDCAVFSNLSRDHLDYHQDIEQYARAKQKLFDQYPITHAVINADSDTGRSFVEHIKYQVPVTAVVAQEQAIEGIDRYIVAKNISTHPNGLHLEFDSYQGSGVIESPLLGDFNAFNLLDALGILLHWAIPLDQAIASLSSVTAPIGRMEAFGRPNDPCVVVDYAHTPDALRSAISALRKHCRGKLWCVFGCGGDRDRGKREQMAQAAQKADFVVVTNDNPRHEEPSKIIDQILQGFKTNSSEPTAAEVSVEPDREKAIAYAIDQASPGDIVLVAGKGHEDYQQIGNQRLALSDRALVTQMVKGKAQRSANE